MRLLVSLGVAALLLVPSTASAFCRTTSKAIPAEFSPTADQPCWTGGLPLFWRNACVGFAMQKNASTQISFDDAVQNLTTAFAKWKGASCPSSAGTSSVSIEVRYLGAAVCNQVQYNRDTSIGNANVIMFRDDAWPHDDPNNTIALTTVTYDPTTGELFDADMEINSAQQKFSLVDPPPADKVGFLAAVTHEAGHFLGMAHSPDGNATMFAQYKPTMSNLAADDIAGICSIYQPDGMHIAATGPIAQGQCDPTPRHGFLSECTAPKSGCEESGGSGNWLLVLGAMSIVIASVRKRVLGAS
jgi:Matrixin